LLHPNQFQVNEAWIIFKLNDAPLRTEDGAFDCICLMDAASCFILGNAFIPVNEREPTQIRVRQLLRDGWQHKQEFPTKLFVPIGQLETNLTEEAEHQELKLFVYPKAN